MRDYFIVRFSEFVMVSPASPSPSWLDFVEQCRDLAASLGGGEWFIDSESSKGRTLRFWA